MQIWQQLEIIDLLRKKDAEFFAQKEKEQIAYATWCPQCGKNTSVGYHPYWHIFRRSLCDQCGKEYEAMLKEIGAVDK